MSSPLRLLIQEICPIQGVPLHGTKPRIADDAAKFLFGGAVGYAGGAHDVFFEHDAADVVTAKAQAHLADFQALRHPTRLHVLEVGKEQARNGKTFQTLDGGSLIPLAAAERSVGRLERPGDERGKASGLFLQVVERLQVIDPVLKLFSNAKHHGGSGAYAQLMSGAVHVEPVFGQALQARDAVAHFVVENFGTPAGDGVEPGIAQAGDGIADSKAAVLGDGNDFRRRVAVQVNFRKALLDATQHLLVPVDFQVRMEASLHQYARAAKLDGLANLVVNRCEVEDVSFFRLRPF